VATLPGSRESTARAPVEDRAKRDELVDALGAFVDEYTNRSFVAQSRSGAESVRQVEVGRVLVAGQHGSDASLRPTCRRLLQLALGENTDPGPPSWQGEPPRQARHPAPDHEDVEPL